MIAPPKLPSHDELELLIKEARERQMRRRLLGAAGIAVAAALGLSIHAWVTGGKVDSVAQPPARGSGPSAPLCQSSQLSASAGFRGATQTMLGGVTLQNVSESVCSLHKLRPQTRVSG